MDVISRQDAIDAIWKIKDERDSIYYTSAIHTAIDAIKQLPSAQPEIIRCKDCKHRPDTAWFGCPMVSSIKWHLDGFCSYAERRTDE